MRHICQVLAGRSLWRLNNGADYRGILSCLDAWLCARQLQIQFYFQGFLFMAERNIPKIMSIEIDWIWLVGKGFHMFPYNPKKPGSLSSLTPAPSTHQAPHTSGWLHEPRHGANRGVHRWSAEAQVRRYLHPRQQRAVHQRAAQRSETPEIPEMRIEMQPGIVKMRHLKGGGSCEGLNV